MGKIKRHEMKIEGRGVKNEEKEKRKRKAGET